MKNKGFTLIELIAVLVIMSIITLLATPNVISLMNRGKEEDFLTDVKAMVSKAIVIYKENPETKTVTINSLNGVDDKDAYGYSYKKQDSYIRFIEPEMSNEPQERKMVVFIKSCDVDGKCHCFTTGTADSNAKTLEELEDIKVSNCS